MSPTEHDRRESSGAIPRGPGGGGRRPVAGNGAARFPRPAASRRGLLRGLAVLGFALGRSGGTAAERGVGRLVAGAGVFAREYPEAVRIRKVSDRGGLEAALADVRPGDHIVLADGSYGTTPLVLDLRGTPSRPVVLRAANPLRAHLPGGFDLTAESADVILWGLDLKDAESRLRGTRNILRRCRIWPPFKPDAPSTGIAARRGSDCRIDYCEIRLYTTAEVDRLFGRRWNKTVYSGIWGNYWKRAFPDGDIMKNLVIERCLFTGGPHGVAYRKPNAQFVEAQGDYRKSSRRENWLYWIIRLCYGDVARDRTLFDFKCARMIVDRVHIDSPPGARIQLRDGTTHDVLRCRLPNGAVATHRNDHRIWNTLAAKIHVMAGNAPWDHTGPPRYWAASRNVHVAGCRAALRIGHVYNRDFLYPAEGTLVENHRGPVTYGLETDTRVGESSSVAAEEPVLLSAAEVGPTAPWMGVTP